MRADRLAHVIRRVALLFAVVFALAFTGCGSGSAKNKADEGVERVVQEGGNYIREPTKYLGEKQLRNTWEDTYCRNAYPTPPECE